MKHIIGTTINGVDYNTMIFENDTFYPAGYDGEVKLYGTLGMIGLDQNYVKLLLIIMVVNHAILSFKGISIRFLNTFTKIHKSKS